MAGMTKKMERALLKAGFTVTTITDPTAEYPARCIARKNGRIVTAHSAMNLQRAVGGVHLLLIGEELPE